MLGVLHTERRWRPASLSNHTGFHRQVTLTVIRITCTSLNASRALNPYSSTDTTGDTLRRRTELHWAVDAIAITWASLGFAAIGLIVVGAFALTGTLSSLASDEDAYIALVAVPFVVGFAAVGAFIGCYFRSRYIGAAACFVPLFVFASLLWLSDYFGDLGEGEQVVTLYANGLYIGGLSMIPAFLRLPHAPRLVSLTLPHAVVCLVGLYFAYTFGL
ncbi:hypothetical protein [Rhodopirellula europaea]|uniref:hypothetical protein n=1 Tax=Rhodopirellula europaea TaxID=1263866 RepID=UPI003D2CA4E3|tara:strand:+ start:2033 stop:2683 length:651 start_codon:yes stop_codon:yes gene_type:complete